MKKSLLLTVFPCALLGALSSAPSIALDWSLEAGIEGRRFIEEAAYPKQVDDQWLSSNTAVLANHQGQDLFYSSILLNQSSNRRMCETSSLTNLWCGKDKWDFVRSTLVCNAITD